MASVYIILHADPKTPRSGSPQPLPLRARLRTPYVVSSAAEYSAICCVFVPGRDPAPSSRKQQCGYFMCVVHFRKVVIRQKIGSNRNGYPVIYRRGYMPDYYQPENDDGREKSLT